ncbi:MAG TPA: HAMP domain-containing sensor histidine kinase [Fimbriimonadaceae bacterium]|nr:HAMP domain-containing sensor histidine kinase [Fimbriimonadaceae bacterium]
MHSFRARLTFWNAVVIVVVLVAFSAGIVYANQHRLAADIDAQLADRALHAPLPNPPPPNQDFDGQAEAPNAPLPPRFSDPAAIRFADVRRPRAFDPQGQPRGPLRDPPFDPVALRRALRGESVYSDGEFDNEPIRIFTTPIRQGPNQGDVVQVARETSDLHHIWSAQLWTMLLFLPGAVLAAAAGAFFLTSRATRPLANLKRAANAISEQDLSQRLEIEGEDEFAELGETFNAMLHRLDKSFTDLRSAYTELEQAHEAQKRFTADVSHELRTPLTRLRLATSTALSAGSTNEDRTKALKVADQAAESMSRLVQEMLVLARADSGQLKIRHEPIDLRSLAADVLESYAPDGTEMIADLQDSPVKVEGDPDHLQRVLTNLIDNSIRYTPKGGFVKVSVAAEPDWALVSVADSGVGIAAEHLPHLCERFYRVDHARARDDGGAGLGLAICKTIVEAHGGHITFESSPGKGTTVTIRLPRQP